jgi:hypothetical protein
MDAGRVELLAPMKETNLVCLLAGLTDLMKVLKID